ncbi:aspartate-semialdehyde dehydrogenase [bacterium]|nr:aspartate-semialdehyde dehydrogenase [bacterium]
MKKIGVGVLGATGAVGQRFIQLLENHPWFEVVFIAASQKSSGKIYEKAVKWKQTTSIPKNISTMLVSNVDSKNINGAQIMFSGLDSSVAEEVEKFYAEMGVFVISNSKNHRMYENIPLLIPEINYEHIKLIEKQPWSGAIMTNPNCSATFFTMVAGVLNKRWKIKNINVVTMQAISGAGYPGIPSYDILGNAVPYIGGEEEKMETEPLKIMGELKDGVVEFADITISSQANRVAVIDGHLESVSISFKETPPTIEEIIRELESYESPLSKFNLPSAPKYPIRVMKEEDRPQPRLDAGFENGMVTSVGRVRKDSIFDCKMTVLGHNTLKGAAAAAVLNGELLYSLYPEKFK